MSDMDLLHELELAWRDAGLLDRFGELRAPALRRVADTLMVIEADRATLVSLIRRSHRCRGLTTVAGKKEKGR